MSNDRTMDGNVDTAGWTALGTVVGVMTTLQSLSQIGTTIISAAGAYAAVHFVKLLLHKYAPLKKGKEE